MDPLVSALLEHHPEYAPPQLLNAREVEIVPELQPAPVVFLPVKPVVDQVRAVVMGCGLVEPRMGTILQVVSDFYEISKIELVSQRRHKYVCRPRQVIAYLCREMTTRSFPEIGRFLGGRDHSTVYHGWQKVSEEIKRNERFRDEVEVLKLRLASLIEAA